jgi:hypothetical protein
LDDQAFGVAHHDQLRRHKIVTDDLLTSFVVDAIGSSLNPG